jgi:putative phosphoserine phosphatase/1-acylglycerol-3-phosphate O-acyltransferase
VRGEENLWKSRPAVFVFNHQSKADVVIGAKLLRRDMAGVGKQEIKKMPVIGKVLEMGGVVMIDRKNAASAIEAMQPLVDAMRNEGRSVALAPEGTRTVSPLSGPFKKGAFHLAMQAGVPMVPVVIHNAGDVAPKGDFVFRPATVEVDVLPPVDTSDWSRTPSTSTCARCATCSCAPWASRKSRRRAGSGAAARKRRRRSKAQSPRRRPPAGRRPAKPRPGRGKKPTGEKSAEEEGAPQENRCQEAPAAKDRQAKSKPKSARPAAKTSRRRHDPKARPKSAALSPAMTDPPGARGVAQIVT